MTETDGFGRTDLHYAALEDDAERVASLINAGGDVDLADHDGMTPLHFAGQEYSVSAARALLAAGAQVAVEDVHGNTPLFRAVYAAPDRTELVSLLRERGADPTRENHHGQSPFGLAKLMGAAEKLFPDLAG